MKKFVFVLVCLFIVIITYPQSYYDGYTLYSCQNTNKAYLIDMSGNTYHEWTFATDKKTGYSSHLLAGGAIVRTVATQSNPFSGGGGITGGVQIVEWDGTVTWDYTYCSSTYSIHHDICPMPNGNVLMICYESKSATEAVQAGCSSSTNINAEKIIEVQPTGTNTGTIVWEWHVWDHLCQNYNSSKDNYVSSIVQNPQLININYNTQTDWMHMNGIDYNETLDQIVLSSHNLNEIYVIDHSTTTVEAAGHTGGNSGKGGDILYRWGNPSAYNASGTTNFNVVHDAHWVPYDCPNGGYLSAYNNKGGSGNKSASDVIDPPLNGYTYNITLGQAYTPSTYTDRYTSSYSSNNMGSCQQLPNGNTLMCIPGMLNYLIEVDASGSTVWSKNISGGSIAQAFRYSACYVDGPPEIDVSASQSIVCAGASVQLTSTVTGSSLSYVWDSDPSGFSSTAQNPSVTPTTTTTTTYYVTVTDGNGCTNTDEIAITIGSGPTADAGSDLSICQGESTVLTASGGASYLWDNGLGSGVSQTVSPGTTTIYTVTVTDAVGCTGTDDVTVTVLSSPIASAGSDVSICAGESTTLTASGGASYSWDNSLGSGATHAVSPTSTTIYSVTVTNASGCTAVDDVTVTVSSSLTADAGSDVSICQGESTMLTASGGTSYIWDNGIGSGANQTVSPNSTTTYTVTVTNASGCSGTDNVTITVNGSPTANAGSNVSICYGESTVLTASGGVSYVWDNSLGSGISHTVSPTTTTIYTVTVSNSSGCTDTDNTVITVNSLPIVDAGTDQSISYGTSTSLLATVSGGTGTYSYSWSPADSLVDPYIEDPVTVNLYSSNVFTLTSTDASTGCQNSDNVIITVTGGVLTAFTYVDQDTICPGESVQLHAVPGGGAGSYTYTWSSTPAGFSSSIQDPAVSPTSTTTYHVLVDDGSDTFSSDVTVFVASIPVANAGADQTICDGSSITLTATGGVSYVWSNSVVQGVPFVPTVSQTYYVTVYNAQGCWDVDDIEVTLAQDLYVDLTISGQNSFCEGESVTYYANGIYPGNNPVYNWYINGSVVQSGADTSFISSSLSDGDIVTCILNSSESCVTNNPATSNAINLSVTPIPTADFIYGTNWLEVDFMNTSSDATSYLWNYGDGNSSNFPAQTHVYLNSGIYDVTLIAFNSCGSDTVVYTINVVSVSTDQVDSKENFIVYPNPARTKIYIKCVGYNEDELIVHDLLGNIIFQSDEHKDIISIDLSPYADGVYFVKIGEIYERIVLQH